MLELVNLRHDFVLIHSLVLVNIVHCVHLHYWNVWYKLTFLLFLALHIVCQDNWIVTLGCDDTT